MGIVRNFTEDNSRNGSIKLFVVGARPIYSNRWKTPTENCDTFVHARLGSQEQVNIIYLTDILKKQLMLLKLLNVLEI